MEECIKSRENSLSDEGIISQHSVVNVNPSMNNTEENLEGLEVGSSQSSPRFPKVESVGTVISESSGKKISTPGFGKLQFPTIKDCAPPSDSKLHENKHIVVDDSFSLENNINMSSLPRNLKLPESYKLPPIKESTPNLHSEELLREKDKEKLHRLTYQEPKSKISALEVSAKLRNSTVVSKSRNTIILSRDTHEESEDESDVLFSDSDEENDEEEMHKEYPCKYKINKVLDSIYFGIFITIITIYALFFDDIRLIAFQKKHDNVIYGITTFVLLCFTLEIILASYAKEGYFNSFFFWLDIIATASLITDIGWIMGDEEQGILSSVALIAKTARAGRSTRIIRIVRMVRLVRIIKLYKQAKQQQDKAHKRQEIEYRRESLFIKKDGISRGSLFKRGRSESIFHRRETLRKLVMDRAVMMQRNLLVSSQMLGKTKSRQSSGFDLLGYAEGVGAVSPSNIKKLEQKAVTDLPTNYYNPTNRMLPLITQNPHLTPQNHISRPPPKKISSAVNLPIINESNDESPNISQNVRELAEIPGLINTKAGFPTNKEILPPIHSPIYQFEDQEMRKKQQELEFKIPKESQVGKKLSALTTRRVIILILAMLFILPWFSDFTYITPYTSYKYGLEALSRLSLNSEEYTKTYEKYLDRHSEGSEEKTPIIYLKAKDKLTYESIDIEDLRLMEYEEYSVASSTFQSRIDYRYIVKFEAWLNIGRTLFICIILSIGSITFDSDANNLVLFPIERMIEKVKAIAHNPLMSQTDWEEAGIFSVLHKQELKNKGKDSTPAAYETDLLEKTILKIGRLLALGFGEAGSRIIADNMSHAGDMNPMIPGSQIFAIFGFCYIRDFQSLTKVLQQDAPRLVNHIAEIVHASVHKYNGSVNRNLGDSFLLVWKFPQTAIKRTVKEEEKSESLNVSEDENQSIEDRSKTPEEFEVGVIKGNFDVKVNADLALFSFIKIISKINKLEHIDEYSREERIRRILPGFSVSMGFGLHTGWGIEGAIGSYHKIDASYLSPNVNIAARLEMATHQYGVDLLISGNVYDLLSQRGKSYTREIDVVTVKGSLQPIKLYTVDLEPKWLLHKKATYLDKGREKKKELRLHKSKRLLQKLYSGETTTGELYQSYKDLRAMRQHLSIHFFKQFRKGYQSYIKGNWKHAYVSLEKALKLKPHDGPTYALFGF